MVETKKKKKLIVKVKHSPSGSADLQSHSVHLYNGRYLAEDKWGSRKGGGNSVTGRVLNKSADICHHSPRSSKPEGDTLLINIMTGDKSRMPHPKGLFRGNNQTNTHKKMLDRIVSRAEVVFELFWDGESVM